MLKTKTTLKIAVQEKYLYAQKKNYRVIRLHPTQVGQSNIVHISVSTQRTLMSQWSRDDLVFLSFS